MKIIKHGKLKPRKFICWCCECEFVEDVSEYSATIVDRSVLWYSSLCPECGSGTTNSEPWEEQENE